MVDLHYLDAAVQAGITRYSVELAGALEGIGVPVRRFPVRPVEAQVLGRRTGGYLSMRLQGLWKPLRKRGLLHSTHLYSAHPRADVVTVHDCFPETYAAELGVAAWERRAFARQLARLEGRRAQYITPTHAVRRTFLELHPEIDEGRVHPTLEGVGDGFRPPAPGEARHPAFADGCFNVLCVADLNPRKRLDWLLEAALAVDDGRLRVVHVGTGLPRRPAWRRQAEREAPLAKRLGGRFVRLGHLEPEALASAYRSADLFVLPSLDEGFGFPPLEALASGTPVAVTERPVFREVLGDEADYFADAAGLARVLGRAVRSRRTTPAARRKRNAFVRSRYGWPDVARRTLAVYQQAEGGRR